MSVDKTLLEFTKCDVFTPEQISRQMTSLLPPKHKGSLLEPSVGNGQLLRFLPFDSYDTIDVYDIKKEYIEALPTHYKLHANIGDFMTTKLRRKYDAIIMNPPFIKIQDLSADYRDTIRTLFPLFSKGNIDLYYCFIVKCIAALKKTGKMVAITPNSFLYTKSATPLRQFLIENQLIERIIDFKSEKVFDGVSVYCCITVFSHKSKTTLQYNDTTIQYSDITNTEYNIFSTPTDTSTNITTTLRDICKIRNGIATLRDKIFIHSTKKWEEPCWRQITTGRETKWAIYPYSPDGTIIDEDTFKTNNPNTYAYLCKQKDELAKRDKGNKTYPAWYAYGRSQSIKLPATSHALYIPTFVDPTSIPIHIISPPILHISCLCIIPNNPTDISLIRHTIIESSKKIGDMSSKRGGGWISLSTRVLNSLPIIPLPPPTDTTE